MRVVFDGYWWVEGPLSNQMVQRQFITTWLRDNPDDSATVVVPRADERRVRRELDSRAEVVGTRLRPHGLAAAVDLGRVARRSHADVIVSHNFTPVSGTAVTFIHDVLFITRPEWFTVPERIYLAPIPLLARRAGAVVTSSINEANRIGTYRPRLLPVVPVGLSIGTALTTAHPTRPAGMPSVNDFVLTVGRLNIRKNLARTIAASLLSSAISPSRPLVVVGEPDGRGLMLDTQIAKAREQGAVVFLAGVNDAGLAWLYGNTTLFIFLTLDEGWGLPAQEARYFGAPALVSDIPVFREHIGTDCTFVDPLDTTAIAHELSQLLSSPGSAARSPRGSRTAVDDEWSACTKRLRDVAVQTSADRA